MHSKEPDKKTNPSCPVRQTLEIIGGKWSFAIIYSLMEGHKRFSELERILSGISTRMLTRELKSLEKHGIVSRKVLSSLPPNVEYSLTERGLDLRPVFTEIQLWAKQHPVAV